MKDVIKVTVALDTKENNNTAEVTVALDEQVLDHMVKTSKLGACQKIAEVIPEIREALGRLVEEKFFGTKKSVIKKCVDEVFEDGFSKTKYTAK